MNLKNSIANLSILFAALLSSACENQLGDLSVKGDHFPLEEIELTVTDGLIAWFNAEAIANTSQGDRVSSWEDQSEEGNDATQSTINQQPLFQDGSNGINGLPSLLFGSSNELTNVITSSVTVTNRSLFVVMEILGSPAFTTGPIFLHKDNLGTDDYGLDANTNYTINYPPGSTTTGSLSANSEVVITSTIIDTSETLVYIDGSLDSSVTHAAADTVGGIVFGGDQGANVINGEIAEILVYDRAVSSEERESIESYLNSRYSAF